MAKRFTRVNVRVRSRCHPAAIYRQDGSADPEHWRKGAELMASQLLAHLDGRRQTVSERGQQLERHPAVRATDLAYYDASKAGRSLRHPLDRAAT